MEDKRQLGQVASWPEGPITHIEFEHPAHNSLPGRLLAELKTVIEAAGADADCRVIVLRSGGDRTFCAGASFEELQAVQNRTEGLHFFSGFANVINAMRACPKFIIGRVQGKAIGGGVGLAASTDYCLATQYAAVKLSELAIGIGPFVVGPAVERKLGTAAFQELSIDASNFRTASWARERGLYQAVFDDLPTLDEQLMQLAHQLAAYSPAAMQHLKRIHWQGTEHWDELLIERAAISGELVLSEHTRRAISAFKS